MDLYHGDLKELLDKMCRQGIQHIWVDGGVTLSQFLALELVDHLIVSIIPILLGDGMPLFHRISKEIPCRLVSSESYPSGLVQLRYDLK